MSQEEVAVLLEAGRDGRPTSCFLPASPDPARRARDSASVSFDERHAECRAFWQEKLARGGQVRLPEPRIREMMRAGLLHLDLVTYGLEPDGHARSDHRRLQPHRLGELARSFSSWTRWAGTMSARRALVYFLDKQHEDGFIQNFGGYMLETGAALWSHGRALPLHARRRLGARRSSPSCSRPATSCIAWRERNMREELRGKGYGMLEGKMPTPRIRSTPSCSTATPTWAERVAEMLAGIDPAAVASAGASEALALKNDIRTALFEAMARSPVVPLGDGTWCPTVAALGRVPRPGLRCMPTAATGSRHGTFVRRDSLLGPLYLVFQEVLDPDEPAATFLLNFHNELDDHKERGLQPALLQPASRSSHLQRGEVKPFLKAYYNTVAGLADRETYTFWEHYFQRQPAQDARGRLVPDGHPLDALHGGRRHARPAAGYPAELSRERQADPLQRVATYFGPVSLQVESMLDQGRVEATVECRTNRKPKPSNCACRTRRACGDGGRGRQVRSANRTGSHRAL